MPMQEEPFEGTIAEALVKVADDIPAIQSNLTKLEQALLGFTKAQSGDDAKNAFDTIVDNAADADGRVQALIGNLSNILGQYAMIALESINGNNQISN